MNSAVKLVPATFLLFSFSTCLGQWDKAAQQIPSLRSLPDQTEELQVQLESSGGTLVLDAKRYRITRPLEVDLTTLGAAKIQASAGTTLIMDGPGPAIRFKGSHTGTASPRSFKPATWNERMPIVSGIEILV